jgi:hypothetical protein
MVTIAKELHGGLQKLNAKLRNCLYMLHVMAGIRSANVKPPPKTLSSPSHATPFSVNTISMTPPLPYSTSPSATVVTMGVHTTKTGNTAKIIDKVMALLLAQASTGIGSRSG